MTRYWQSMAQISVLALALYFSAEFAFAASSPQGLHLQGRIVQSDGQPVEGTSVDFTIQILSPGAEACVLFEETHTLNMASSDGVFSIRVGTGTRTGAGFEDTSSLAQVFNNASAAMNSLNCSVGTSYAPNSGEARKLRMTFNDGSGSGLQTLAQDQVIQAVPYALNADRVGGKVAGDLIQTITALEVAPGTTQSRFEQIFNTDYTGLQALLAGTSALYAKANPTSAVAWNGQRLTNVADPTAAQDAATKNYSDTKIGGNTANLGTLVVGDANKVVMWDGTKFVAQAIPADATKLSLSGGTMTGAINMGGQNITAAGHVQLSNQATLLLGRYTNAQEATLVGGLAAADKGRTWFNTDTNRVRYWNGTAASDVGAGTVTSVSGTAPVQVATGTTTPVISIDDATSSAKGAVQVGTGLNVASGVVSVAFGNVDNTAVEADSIPNCTAAQKLQRSLGPTFTWSCVADVDTGLTSETDPSVSAFAKAALPTCAAGQVLKADGTSLSCVADDNVDTTKVAKAGDTMTGTLNLPANGLVAGTTQLVLTSGKVGIGTAAPTSQLEVVGANTPWGNIRTNVTDNGNTALTGITLQRSRADATAPGAGFGTNLLYNLEGFTDGSQAPAASMNVTWENAQSNDTTDRNARIDFNSLSANSFSTKMTVRSSGNVGIGTTSPTSKLHVVGEIRSGLQTGASGSISLIDTGGVTWNFANTGNHLVLSHNAGSASNFVINATNGANVGIGATAPDTKLQVAGTIRVGDGGETCASGNFTGGIRYNGGNVQFCDGASWKTLGVAGAGITALTGDVTASGTGSVAGTISNDAVTFAKMQNIATNKLLGRATAGSGDTEEITLGTALSYTGTTLNVTESDPTVTAFAKAALPTCGAGQVLKGDGTSLSCVADSTTDSTKVAKAGDTMTGTLNLPANGLVVGTSQLVASGGNVGIGTTNPGAALNVTGSMLLGGTGFKAYSGTVPKLEITHSSIANTDVDGGTLALYGTSTAAVNAGSAIVFGGTYNGTTTATGGRMRVAKENATVGDYSFYYAFDTRHNGGVLTEKLRIDSNGKVGIGVTNPDTVLQVAGTLRVGDGGETCAGGNFTGGIRYNSGSLQYCNGTSWQSLGTSSATGDFMASGAVPMTGTLEGKDGTAASPSFAFDSEPTTGMYRNGLNDIGFSVGGAASLRILGTSNAYISSGLLRMANGAVGSPAFGFENDNNTGFWTPGDGIVGFTSNNSEVFRFHSNGVRLAPKALPGTPANGDIAIDSGDGNKLKYYNGSWHTLSDDTGITQLTGDVTAGAGSGSQAATIANDAVTFAKMQNINTARILGRTTASAGDVEEISAGAGITLSGGSLSVTFGDVDNTAVEADSIPNCTAAEKLQRSLGPTFTWSCVSDQSTDSSKVAKAGDTMTGALNLPANGLQIAAGALSGSPSTGMLAIDSGDANTLKYYDGSSWQKLVSSGLIPNPLFFSPDGSNTFSVGMTGSGGAAARTALKVTAAPTTGVVSQVQLTAGDLARGLIIDSINRTTIGRYISSSLVSQPVSLLVTSGSGSSSEDINLADFTNSNGSSSGSGVGIRSFGGGTETSTLVLQTSRNGSIVASGDMLGRISFAGSNAAAASLGTQTIGARILGEVDGTASVSNDMPGRLVFQTTADGSGTPTERMRINSSGNVGIGVTNPDTKLQVAGTLRVGDGGETCAGGNFAGAIRYNGGNLQFCNGTAWTTLGTGSGAGDFKSDGSVSMTGPVKAANGDATAPGIMFASDTDTGFFGTGSNSLYFTAGGVARFRFTTSGIVSESNGSFVLSSGTSAANPSFTFVNNNDTGMYRATTDTIGFSTAGTEKLRVHAGGGVRLAPSALPGTPANGDIAIDSGDGNKLKYYNGSWQVLGTDTDTGITQLTGDVTTAAGSGAQAATIAANAVTTAKINDGAVTTAKLFANPGINRLVATDPTTGAALAALACASSGDYLSWSTVSGWQCTALAASAFGSQAANTVMAAPNGSAGAPSFRALASADIPNLDAAKTTTGTFAVARLGSGTADSTKFLRGDGSWQTVSIPAQPYVIGGTFVGAMDNSQVLIQHPFPIAVTIPAGCTNSRFELAIAATASTTISLSKCTGSGFTSCTQFGTATVGASGKVASFSCASATSFTAGTDSLLMTGPATADGTAATAGWAIYGTR